MRHEFYRRAATALAIGACVFFGWMHLLVATGLAAWDAVSS